MRRESSTVVVLVGEVTGPLLTGVSQLQNVSVAQASGTQPPGTQASSAALGWEPGAQALRAAARRRSMYVIVPEDPLADVAAAWRAMWEGPGGPDAAAAFEARAADALDAWHSKRFELPDYYLVVAPADYSTTRPDLYLGPLHALRPRRVAVGGRAGAPEQARQLLDTLRSLEHGPWWPPLDELLDAARGFYAGSLAPTATTENGDD